MKTTTRRQMLANAPAATGRALLKTELSMPVGEHVIRVTEAVQPVQPGARLGGRSIANSSAWA
jgi:hypothetical protein